MADKKENELSAGIPVQLRGIDAEGNSITPTMEEVTDGLPVATFTNKGLMSSNQALLSDTLHFSLGVPGGSSTMYFRLGRFRSGHYYPIRLCVSYGSWDITPRTVIDVTITNGNGNIIISGKGYSQVGYVAGSGYTDIYFACASAASVVGSICGILLEGRAITEEVPVGIEFIP